MKIILPTAILITFICCSEQKPGDNVLKAKNKTIDSLKTALTDCKAQAHIMADILEEERIELEKKKTDK